MPAQDRTSETTDAGEASGLNIVQEGDRLHIQAHGDWSIREAGRLDLRLAEPGLSREASQADNIVLELGGLAKLDTAGAWLLVRATRAWREAGATVEITGASEPHTTLLEDVRSRMDAPPPETRQNHPIRESLGELADVTRGIGRYLASLVAFFGLVLGVAARTLVAPGRFRATSFVHHIEHGAFRAIPIIALISLLVGAVIMQQGAHQLRRFGAEIFAVDMLAILTLREVAILLTAVLLAGRSGSAFTAEIGTMKMREEIDAMRTLGIDPVETLVLPRVLALIVALPLLVFVSDVMCLAGGAIAANLSLDLDAAAYLERVRAAANMRHFTVGLVKAPFVAVVIGLVGCLEGFLVAGSAESLGRRTTSSVVKAIVLVIVLDAVLAIFLTAIGF